MLAQPAVEGVRNSASGSSGEARVGTERCLASNDPELRQQMVDFQDQLRQTAEAKGAAVRADAQNQVSGLR